ncbi:MAG: ribonuclease R [Ignavibacteria bacterium]|jgi:ribonuclease R
MKKEIKAFFKKRPSLRIKAKELSKKLNATEPHQYAKLKEVLFKLTEEGYLEKAGKRFKLLTKNKSALIGKLSIMENGNYGFVSLEDTKKKDVFIPEKYLSTAFNGDTVEVSLLANKRGKNLEGQIINIVTRARKEFVGVLNKSKSFYFVEPDDIKVHRDFYIASENLNRAKNGDKVVVSDIEWTNPLLNPEGKIKEILGKAGSYDAEISALAREFNLPYTFSKDVISETEKISGSIPSSEIKKRLDLRDIVVFTIDPEDAKDFDDAVSIDFLDNGNYLLGIHIADVSHYVDFNSAIYNEALNRATSVYFVGKVIPMLPEKLSNNICSLVPNKDRLTYSVMVEFTPRGKLVDYCIVKSVINSKRRFTYEETQAIIETGEGDCKNEILKLNAVAKTLKRKRLRKGSINFITPEVKFELDKNGVPIGVNIKKIKDSNNLIEELMLLANQIVASHINKNKGRIENPFVYRVHDVPDKDKIAEFSGFVKTLGYQYQADFTNPKALQKLLDEVQGTEEEALINEIAIRSMAKAVYSINNIGHYGLGFDFYTHFTSPIRRFPDLIVHKLIFNYIEKKENLLSANELSEICDHASNRERNAINAERQSVKLKQIEFLKNKIGFEYYGIISGIANFGIFVEICESLAEGLVRLKDMDDDYYLLDEKNYSIIGRSSKRKFRLGDKVNVKIINVNEERREIDLKII